MGVYIKGMEMPIGCDYCEFCKRDISGYDWCCIPMVNGRSKPLDEPVMKPDWCPLVPVLPHGDLVDKKTVTENLAQVLNNGKPPVYYPNWNDAVLAVFTAPIIIPAEQIDNAPTVIEAEGGNEDE